MSRFPSTYPGLEEDLAALKLKIGSNKPNKQPQEPVDLGVVEKALQQQKKEYQKALQQQKEEYQEAINALENRVATEKRVLIDQIKAQLLVENQLATKEREVKEEYQKALQQQKEEYQKAINALENRVATEKRVLIDQIKAQLLVENQLATKEREVSELTAKLAKLEAEARRPALRKILYILRHELF
jgi:translation initiation factor 2 alpha subunit (eIF-2alpha)